MSEQPTPHMTPKSHGGSVEVPPEALLAPDPELYLVWADMNAWAEAHPCECHAMCTCEDTSDES